MPNYPNPYDFVPLESSKPGRTRWQEAENGMASYLPDRYSGRLYCTLHPETPLFVHGQGQQHQKRRGFLRIGGQPGIPAASLKGALRSIYEIVTDSCFSSLSDQYRASRSSIRINRRMPPGYLPCHDLQSVCPACLLFGMVEQNLPANRQARALAGRLSISDGRPVSVRPRRISMPAPGGGPQPRHATFYFQENGEGEVLGRKLYFHHRDYEETIQLYGDGGRPGLMEVEGQSGIFAFTIDFVNLSQAELGYLCYTLLLEEGVRHHLAYGKSYGLGSARMEIARIQLLHGPGQRAVERFLTLAPPSSPTGDPLPLAAQGKAQWLARSGGEAAHAEFSRILAWPGIDLYQYPTFGWFRHTPGSGDVTLAQYQSGMRTPTRNEPRPQPPPQSSPEGDDIRAQLRRRLGLDKE